MLWLKGRRYIYGFGFENVVFPDIRRLFSLTYYQTKKTVMKHFILSPYVWPPFHCLNTEVH